MSIDDMPAGRELDALIAEKVMGREICDEEEWSVQTSRSGLRVEGMVCPKHGLNSCLQRAFLPFYSTDIAAAWEVFEAVQEGITGKVYGGSILAAYVGGLNGYFAEFKRGCEPGPLEVSEFGVTAPLAICRAALKAVDA